MDLYLSVYYEKSGHDSWDTGWLKVYKPDGDPSSLTCSDRYMHAAANFRLQSQSTAHVTSTIGVNDMAVTGYAYFKASNPKFFFVSLSNCDPACSCDLTKYPDCTPSSSANFCR